MVSYDAVPFSDHAGDSPNSWGWLVRGPLGLYGRCGDGKIGFGGQTITKKEAQDWAREMNGEKR